MRNPISFTKTARFGALGLTVPPSASTPSVLFYGAAGLDLLCFVAQYPEADDKVRALGQLQAGGGNAANSACAAAKLGVDAHICTKIGCDANGTTILQGLQEAGVNTTHVLRSQTSQSGSTYVLVCPDGTRTCIHSPMTEEVTDADVGAAFSSIYASTGISLTEFDMAHFDSRHTEASVGLAAKARAAGVLISVDLEKERPHLMRLLPLCDVIFTNKDCSGALYPDEPDRLTRLGRVFSEPWGVSCQMLVSTLGEDGCVLLLPSGGSGGSGGGLLERARSTAQRHPKDYAVWGQMEQRIGALSTINTTEEVQVILGREYRVISCSALPLSCVTDSTGAGDAFIGAFIAAWVHGWAPPNCMKLGTLGAGMKLQQQGARAGQPTLQQVIDILDQSA